MSLIYSKKQQKYCLKAVFFCGKSIKKVKNRENREKSRKKVLTFYFWRDRIGNSYSKSRCDLYGKKRKRGKFEVA